MWPTDEEVTKRLCRQFRASTAFPVSSGPNAPHSADLRTNLGASVHLIVIYLCFNKVGDETTKEAIIWHISAQTDHDIRKSHWIRQNLDIPFYINSYRPGWISCTYYGTSLHPGELLQALFGRGHAEATFKASSYFPVFEPSINIQHICEDHSVASGAPGRPWPRYLPVTYIVYFPQINYADQSREESDGIIVWEQRDFVEKSYQARVCHIAVPSDVQLQRSVVHIERSYTEQTARSLVVELLGPLSRSWSTIDIQKRFVSQEGDVFKCVPNVPAHSELHDVAVTESELFKRFGKQSRPIQARKSFLTLMEYPPVMWSNHDQRKWRESLETIHGATSISGPGYTEFAKKLSDIASNAVLYYEDIHRTTDTTAFPIAHSWSGDFAVHIDRNQQFDNSRRERTSAFSQVYSPDSFKTANSPGSFMTARSPYSFMTAASPYSFMTAPSPHDTSGLTVTSRLNAMATIPTIEEEGPSSPVIPATLNKTALEKLQEEYIHHLTAKGILQPVGEQLDWSGFGQHVIFRPKVKIPLTAVGPLGASLTAKVDKVLCRRILLARKTMRCNRQLRLSEVANELLHLNNLRHFHIVQLVGSYIQGREFSILMYPVADCHLGTFLEDTADMVEELDTCSLQGESEFEKRITFLVASWGCLASALVHVHEHTTKHMDIKPQNILVRRTNSKPMWRVYLADFGLSRTFATTGHSQTDGATSLTPRYCAPEVFAYAFRGRAADIFSLGCVFAEIYTVCRLSSPQDFADYRQREGDGNNDNFHCNLNAILRWLEEELGSEPDSEDTDMLEIRSTILSMMSEDPQRRPTAKEVAASIDFDLPCCSMDPEPYTAHEASDTTIEEVESVSEPTWKGLQIRLRKKLSRIRALRTSSSMKRLSLSSKV